MVRGPCTKEWSEVAASAECESDELVPVKEDILTKKNSLIISSKIQCVVLNSSWVINILRISRLGGRLYEGMDWGGGRVQEEGRRASWIPSTSVYCGSATSADLALGIARHRLFTIKVATSTRHITLHELPSTPMTMTSAPMLGLFKVRGVSEEVSTSFCG